MTYIQRGDIERLEDEATRELKDVKDGFEARMRSKDISAEKKNYYKSERRFFEYKSSFLYELTKHPNYRVPCIELDGSNVYDDVLWKKMGLPLASEPGQDPRFVLVLKHYESGANPEMIDHYGLEYALKQAKKDMPKTKFFFVPIFTPGKDLRAPLATLVPHFDDLFAETFPLWGRGLTSLYDPVEGAQGLRLYDQMMVNGLLESIRRSKAPMYSEKSTVDIASPEIAVGYSCEVCDANTTMAYTDENGDTISVCSVKCQMVYMEIEKKGLFPGTEETVRVNVVLREAISDTEARVLVLSRDGNRETEVKWIGRYFARNEQELEEEKRVRKAYLEQLCEDNTYGYMEVVGGGFVDIDIYYGGEYIYGKQKLRHPNHIANLETRLELEAAPKTGLIGLSIEGRPHYWIQSAIKHPGKLTRYAKTHSASGKKTGKNAILGKKANHLSSQDLNQLATVAHMRHDRTLQGEVQFARNARHFKH